MWIHVELPSLLQDPCLPLLSLEQNFDQRQMYLRLRLKRYNYGNTRGTSLYAHLYLSDCPGSCNSGKHFNEALIKSAGIFFLNNVIWLGAGALGWPRGMVWGGNWEGASGWRTRIHPWQIHVNVWQNQYNIAK